MSLTIIQKSACLFLLDKQTDGWCNMGKKTLERNYLRTCIMCSIVSIRRINWNSRISLQLSMGILSLYIGECTSITVIRTQTP